MTTIKTGWLLDNNGEKFAPKTLLSQVSTNDGILLERKIETDLSNLETQIITEKSKRETEIAVERARIDAFTALPEGSTTGDAALEDIKIKADGTTADTPGNAVREQISQLSSDIAHLTDVQIEGYIADLNCLEIWEDGAIDATGDIESPTHNRMRIKGFLDNRIQKIVCNDGYSFAIYRYIDGAQDGTYPFAWVKTIDLDHSEYQYRLFAKKDDGALIGQDIIEHYRNFYLFTKKFDEKVDEISDYLYGKEATYIDHTYISQDGTPITADVSNEAKTAEIDVDSNTTSIIVTANARGYWTNIWGYRTDGSAIALSDNLEFSNSVIQIPNGIVNVKVCDYREGENFSVRIPSIEEKIVNSKGIPKTIVIVDVNGNGDFTNIQSAIEYLKATFDVISIPTTIFVKNGTYDLQPVTDRHSVLDKGGNKISIIGESRDGVKIILHSTPSRNNKIIEHGGDSTIANLSLYNLFTDDGTTLDLATHNPYCIHNDIGFNSRGEKYKTVVKNCYCYNEVYNPIGSGLQGLQTQVYEDCVCELNSELRVADGAISVHTPAAIGAGDCALVIDNCVGIAKYGKRALVLPNVPDSTQYTDIPVSIRRSIFVSDGSVATLVSKENTLLTMDCALNNIDSLNY